MKHINSEKRFQMICCAIMILFAVFCLAPFLLMISASVTDESALINDDFCHNCRHVDQCDHDFYVCLSAFQEGF